MGTKNTDLVANFEATPQVKNNAAELHGVLRTAHGTVELAAGDSDNDDVVMLAPIPSNAAVPSLFIGSDTFGGSCTFNVGIYTTDGTVKDEDVFATAVADAAGISVIPHGGAGTPFGQHFSIASGCAPLSEYFVGSSPGVPLEELPGIPGVVIPRDGFVTPSNAPGFGMEIKEEWLKPFF